MIKYFNLHSITVGCNFSCLNQELFVLLSSRKLARDITWLKSNKVTHVVNTAQGKRFGQVDTDASFYDESGIQYYGVPGHDSIKFDIKKHFEESSAFIDQGNKIGISYKSKILFPSNTLFICILPARSY